MRPLRRIFSIAGSRSAALILDNLSRRNVPRLAMDEVGLNPCKRYTLGLKYGGAVTDNQPPALTPLTTVFRP